MYPKSQSRRRKNCRKTQPPSRKRRKKCRKVFRIIKKFQLNSSSYVQLTGQINFNQIAIKQACKQLDIKYGTSRNVNRPCVATVGPRHSS